jgi:hypothetical protein
MAASSSSPITYAGGAAISNVYAGYYHLIPRLIAFPAGAFRPQYARAIYIWAALTLTGSVLYLVQSPRLPLPFAPLLALAIALLPNRLETYGNLTNVQWFLAIGVIAILSMQPSQSKVSTLTEIAGRLHAASCNTLVRLLGAFRLS